MHIDQVNTSGDVGSVGQEGQDGNRALTGKTDAFKIDVPNRRRGYWWGMVEDNIICENADLGRGIEDVNVDVDHFA